MNQFTPPPNFALQHTGMKVDLMSPPNSPARPLHYYWNVLLVRNNITSEMLKQMVKDFATSRSVVPPDLTLDAYVIEIISKLGVRDMSWENFIIGLNIIGVRDFTFNFQ